MTVPNVLSLTRLFGVPFLYVAAFGDARTAFVVLFVLLGLTDVLDGRIARRWNQCTQLGSLLDAIADVAYYLSAAFFFVYLFPDYLAPNLVYLGVFLAMFVGSLLVSQLKFGRVIFPHTHLTRTNAVLLFAAMLASFYFDTTYVIRALILLYAVAYVEIYAMFFMFGPIDPDTRTIFRLMRQKTDR